MSIDAALRLLSHTPCVSTHRSRAANWQKASLQRKCREHLGFGPAMQAHGLKLMHGLLLEEYVSNRLYNWNVMMLTKVRSDLYGTLFVRSALESFVLKNKYRLPFYLDNACRS